jgi:UDPglucose 6-dehydrogenase
MKVSVVGSGYVGLVTGAGLASRGHDVTCIDIDAEKVRRINAGEPPFHEDGLAELLSRVLKAGKFSATTGYESVRDADAVLICVGTPSRADGGIDLAYVRASAESIGKELAGSSKFTVVTVKSTVVPGTTRSLVPLLEKNSGKKVGAGFGISMVPEFLREGSALEDFEAPDRVVIGADGEKSFEAMRKLHAGFTCPFLETTVETAEMVKYASNGFLATKIGFVNELSAMCEHMGIDIDSVAKGMGLDKRISPQFLRAGPGWGGSCFGKDVRAIVAAQKDAGLSPRILEAVLDANDAQKKRVVDLAQQATGGLSGKLVCVLGLAFKAGTDDIRESPAITIVGELLARGARVVAYDPAATANFKRLYGQIGYANSVEEALTGADACIIVTEWPEFKISAAEYKALMAKPVVIDGRRLLDRKSAHAAGLTYVAVGVGNGGAG